MFRRMMIGLLVAASPAAALGQSDEMGGWALAQMPNGCMVQATSPQGTMLSIWAFAGEAKLAFLLQNRGWNSLRDGANYALKLDTDAQSWPVQAIARQHIDSDGPGLLFTVQPGGSDNSGFIDAFASSKGMRISQNGRSFDTLPLQGSHGAMAALAKCLAERWKAGAPAGDDDNAKKADPAPTTI
ncbi:MAG: hypothetical protein JO013_08270 [Alphaproteobacteria bacterium]|nr:hypothetical protein [Alphaproteobacteria bacterium]